MTKCDYNYKCHAYACTSKSTTTRTKYPIIVDTNFRSLMTNLILQVVCILLIISIYICMDDDYIE